MSKKPTIEQIATSPAGWRSPEPSIAEVERCEAIAASIERMNAALAAAEACKIDDVILAFFSFAMGVKRAADGEVTICQPEQADPISAIRLPRGNVVRNGKGDVAVPMRRQAVIAKHIESLRAGIAMLQSLLPA